MPRRAGSLGRPCDYVADFPDGPVADDAPVGVAEMAQVARVLRSYVAEPGRSVSGLAADSGVSRTTIHDLIAGNSYMDVVTLARLEAALGRRIWGANP